MDRERIFRHLEQRYSSKRDMIARIPLGAQADALWQELLNRRRSSSTVLPINDRLGRPYWYVTTEKMVAASEKIVETLLENEKEFDPYTEAPTIATLEEVFYTSYVDGSQMSIQEAMSFLQAESPPRDVEELLIVNNRKAGGFASSNLYRPINADYIRELASILTEGIDGVLAEYGYRREGNVYRAERPNEQTLVFFCHFGVTCVMLSHFLGVSPMVLWHGTMAAPSSVTALVTEERREGTAILRMLSFGDTAHLTAAGENPAFSGRFCERYTNWDQRHD